MQDTVVYDGECSLTIPLVGEISLSNVLDGECGVITRYRETDYPVYTGTTTVTPRVSEQILETANKTLLEDITVLEVPYYETSNVNGMTVYIASEV